MDPQVIAGRYEVIRAIGSGGMGTVWLCRDTVLGREVAVKRVGALPGEPAAAARAMREARIAASLNDPHAVGVYDIVDQDDAHWLVMEYVAGQSLAEQIRDEGALPPLRVAAIGAAVARALARAHDRGIVHRDIKPGNILIDQSGIPKISDFGIARATADDQLTQTGFMTGTPGYLSPELVTGGDPNSASDVWALGATLYYAVEGAPAYEPQANPLATLQAIAAGDARPLELAGPLGGAIAAMMDRDPSRRWDMREAATRLDGIARGDSTLALPAGAPVTGAAATEVIAGPVDSTQRFDTAPVPTPLSVDPPASTAAAAYLPGDGGPTSPQGPEDEPRKSRAGAWLAGLVVLALLAIGGVFALTSGFGSKTPDERRTTTVTSPSTQTLQPTKNTPTSKTTTSSSTSSSSSSTSSSSTSSTTSTTTTPDADPAAMEQFVQDYYNDVTKAGKRDDTFARLTPEMQASSGGRDGYEAFWSGIKSVDVSAIQADPAKAVVTVEMQFKRSDGTTSDETYRIKLVPSGDSYLIARGTRG